MRREICQWACRLSVLFFLLAGCGLQAQDKERFLRSLEEQERFSARLASGIADAITPYHPKVRTFALRMAQLSPGPYNIGQVCALWSYLKKNWNYLSDPKGFDYFAPAFESVEANLAGDCDDFAILMASCVQSIGGSARIVLAYNQSGAHAYCEVFISKDSREAAKIAGQIGPFMSQENSGSGQHVPGRIYFHTDRRGYWLHLDYNGLYPGDKPFAAEFEIAVYPGGEWEVL